MKREASIESFIGRKSSGKTYAMKQRVKDFKNALLTSPNTHAEFTGGCVMLRSFSDMKRAAKAFDRRKKVHYFYEAGGSAGFETFELCVKFARVCGIALAVDELQRYLPKNIPQSKIVSDLIYMNRHIGGRDIKNPTGVPFLYTAPLHTAVAPEVHNSTDVMTFFKSHEKNYKMRLADTFDKDLVEKLLAAPMYSKLVMDVKAGPRFVPFKEVKK